MLSHAVIGLLRLASVLPLSWLRLVGRLLGWLLYWVVPRRRHIARVNLSLCFPALDAQQIDQLAREHFRYFAQAWVDRSWLWHGPAGNARKRLQLVGALEELAGAEPVVIFAPHFVGLDAGWTALTQQLPRAFTTIYTNQADKVADQWILKGRRRFGQGRLFGRIDGVKTIVAALREGQPLYLLPDMNFGPEESVWVPFYGVPAATVPSLSRFSRLGRAKVVPVVTRMTPEGYQVQVLPAWSDFPTGDAVADTARMNRRLQGYIDAMPTQYYWVHKRFKDRPPGEPGVY
jgi:KDO2-lipid IV(A) lauroyltransferase